VNSTIVNHHVTFLHLIGIICSRQFILVLCSQKTARFVRYQT